MSKTDGLWFVSMVGSQTALKAISASLLKQPPDAAHLIRGADGMALQRRLPALHHPLRDHWNVDDQDNARLSRRPAAGMSFVYTKTAEFGYEKDSFLLLAQSAEEAPALHHRFLDKRSPLPLHGSWADWLWERGIEEEEIIPSSRWASPPTGAPPRPRSFGKTCPTRWRRAGSRCPLRRPMDRTLKKAKRNSKRRGRRNYGAWERFSPDGKTCRYCPHDNTQHLMSLGAAAFLPPRDGGGAAGPLGHALPAHPAGGRLGAGAADDRRQQGRADNGLLRRLRREHWHGPGALLPAELGHRRRWWGWRTRHKDMAIAA